MDEFIELCYSALDDAPDMPDYTALEVALVDYKQMIENGVPKEEARQVLPNAMCVNILWTVNFRSLINFFRQRMCKRNVEEMLVFATKVWEEINTYWPDYADLVGPPCYTDGRCNQGRMSCGEPIKQNERG